MSRRRIIIIVASSNASQGTTIALAAEAALPEDMKVTVEYDVPAAMTNEAAATVVSKVLDKLDALLG